MNQVTSHVIYNYAAVKSKQWNLVNRELYKSFPSTNTVKSSNTLRWLRRSWCYRHRSVGRTCRRLQSNIQPLNITHNCEVCTPENDSISQYLLTCVHCTRHESTLWTASSSLRGPDNQFGSSQCLSINRGQTILNPSRRSKLLRGKTMQLLSSSILFGSVRDEVGLKWSHRANKSTQ